MCIYIHFGLVPPNRLRLLEHREPPWWPLRHDTAAIGQQEHGSMMNYLHRIETPEGTALSLYCDALGGNVFWSPPPPPTPSIRDKNIPDMTLKINLNRVFFRCCVGKPPAMVKWYRLQEFEHLAHIRASSSSSATAASTAEAARLAANEMFLLLETIGWRIFFFFSFKVN